MVRIRLRRVGARKQAAYRIVVTDKRSPRDGRYIEILGHYNPRTRPETVEYKEDRALHWLNVGAQPSEAVARFFKNNGTIDRLKRLQAGEELETLVAEAEAAKAEAPEVNPRTRYEAPKVAQDSEPVAEIVDDVTPAEPEPDTEEPTEEEEKEEPAAATEE
jgi:small subunit ribosomal protein S16